MDVSTVDPYNDRTTVRHVVAHVLSQLNKHPPELGLMESVERLVF